MPAQPTLAELTGLEIRADRIANLDGFGRANYTRAQDSPFEVMDTLIGLERDQPSSTTLSGRRPALQLSTRMQSIGAQINDTGQRLTLSCVMDTRSLVLGEYQIQVRIHDQVSRSNDSAMSDVHDRALATKRHKKQKGFTCLASTRG